MSAELPVFEWYGDRRSFLRGSIRLGAGGLIYAAITPLLAAEIAQDEIPERYFTLNRDGWKNEQQAEFTEIAVPLFAMLVGGRLTVNDKTVELPFAPESPSPELVFSPGGDYLAVWAKHQSARSQVLHRVSILDLTNFEEKPFIEQTFNDSHCYLKWAQNGRHLLVNISPGGILPPRYPYGPMGNLDIYTYVYDASNKSELFGIRGQQGMSISPNGKFLVSSDRQNQNFLWDIEKQDFTVYIDPAPSSFDWSPDSKLLAGFLGSGTQIKSESIGNRNISFEEITGGYQLILLDAASGERIFAQSIGHPSSVGVRFTPDGKRLLFMDGTTGTDKLAVLNLSTGDVERRIDNISVGSDTPFLSLEQNVSFPSRDVLAVLGGSIPPHLDFVDLNTGQVRREEIVRVAADAPVISRDGFISEDTLGLWDYSGARGVRGHKHYLYNFLTKTPIFVNEEASDFGKGIAFGVSSAKDGELLETRDESFVIKDGRKHFVGPAAVELFAAETSVHRMSSSLIEKVPRSENKLDFGAGDILAGPGGRSWYLQNGGRYEIPGRVEDFVQRRHKNMKAYEVPGWVLDRVHQKELPERFFPDQYGRIIDSWSDRLIVVWGGLGSTSKSVMEDHGPFYQLLLEYGWRENQILFGTCNMRAVREGFVPELYDRNHSLRYPPTNINEGKNFYNWLKTKAPLLQVTSYGHSQGGVICFYAGGLSHPDMHCQIITVNAPLVGVDRAVVSVGPFEFEDLSFFKGCESWPVDNWCEALRHYVAEGESTTLRDNVEDWAKLILNNRVELVNFSAKQDPLVGTDRAILKNSTSVINGRELQRVWDIPGALIGNRSPHGRILDHRPFLLEVIKVAGRP